MHFEIDSFAKNNNNNINLVIKGHRIPRDKEILATGLVPNDYCSSRGWMYACRDLHSFSWKTTWPTKSKRAGKQELYWVYATFRRISHGPALWLSVLDVTDAFSDT